MASEDFSAPPASAPGADMIAGAIVPGAWRALGLVSLSTILVLSVWFSTNAIAPALEMDKGISTADLASSGLLTFVGTFEVTQVGSSIAFFGLPGYVWDGEVEPNGDFVVFRLENPRTEPTGSGGFCTFQRRDTFEGNFLTGDIHYAFAFDALTLPLTICAAAGLPCVVEYTGSISSAFALSQEASGQSWPTRGLMPNLTAKRLDALPAPAPHP